jgi:pyruvate/2-oxoglutarate dehydrogenase complex dihydrolipoamide dehydrogenase (E3) component
MTNERTNGEAIDAPARGTESEAHPATRAAFDFVVIGAGPGGEAAAFKARQRGASVAVVERGWVGGACPFIACVPSKSLLHGAERHAAGADYSWSRASERRDYMVNRADDAAEPDDSSHVRRLEDAGAVVVRGIGSVARPGVVRVEHDEAVHELRARAIVVAVGSRTAVPDIPGMSDVPYWTNRDATLARELPASLLVLGGGPSGCELAQAYRRFGVPTTIVQSRDRLVPHDHPRNAEAIRTLLERDGVTVRTGVRAVRVRAGAGRSGAHVVDLGDGSSAEGHAILLAVGRTYPLASLGLETYGFDPSTRGSVPFDGRLRLADGLYLVGDPAGPEMHTHQAHYQGETAVRMALGDDVTPDYRALPRATYTDPEVASVGMSLEEAQAAGLDAFECVAPFATSAKGYSIEATIGHVTIVVDRAAGELVGAAMATDDASAAIHEAVVAIKARIPVAVLAETIHAFPSTSRIFNGLFAEAAGRLATGD